MLLLILEQDEQAEKMKIPPKIGFRQTDTHTHTTELVLVSFPNIWTEKKDLLTSPYLSLGIPQSSRPLAS